MITSVAALRRRVAAWRAQSRNVGLVPTMGALHNGHAALVRRALEQCDHVVVSIFVNPTQFAPHEDFATYPRDEHADMAILSELGTDVVYMPDAAEMYAGDFSTAVSVSQLTEGLCSTTRPHFFQGVATVVAKLLLQCLPDRAYFGEKDYQQLQVVRRMARDLDIPVSIVGVPTAREPDGLALSSRNAYLSAEERLAAPALYRVLQGVAERLRAGESIAAATEWGRQALNDAGFGPVDYLEVRTAETLQPVGPTLPPDAPARVLAAAFLGKTRLIDNVAV